MRKLVAMLLAVLVCLSLGVISSCGKKDSESESVSKSESVEFTGVSQTEWENAFSSAKFENYTLKQTNEVVYSGLTSKQELKVKFVKDACLMSGKIDGAESEYVQYYGAEETNLQKGYYNKIYSAIFENFSNFTYDKAAKNYKTTTDITVNVTTNEGGQPVGMTMVMKNTEVTMDESGNVIGVACDYSMSATEQSGNFTSMGKLALSMSDYATTVITEAEKPAEPTVEPV